LPHGIRRQREHLQRVLGQPIRQRASQLVVLDQGDQRGLVLQGVFRVEGAHARGAEIAKKQIHDGGSF
jgi:hypothetical protein